MNRRFAILTISLLAFLAPATLAAQAPAGADQPTSAEPASSAEKPVEAKDKKEAEKPTEEPAKDPSKDGKDDPKNAEGEKVPPKDEAKAQPDGQGDPAAAEPKVEPDSEPIAKPEPDAGSTETSPFGDSPIADLASEKFEPLEDIEEQTLAQIIPAEVYPRMEWGGGFRTRVMGFVNYDLDTGGTSAILPPLETYATSADDDRQDTSVPSQDSNALWGSNLRLRLDPSIHISEMLEVHAEIDFLDNVVLGSIPAARDGADRVTPELRDTITNSDQRSPQGRYWYEDVMKVNELYGVVRSIFGELWLGRMDDHWGMGMWMNDGDCKDCDYGNNVDRLFLRSGIFGLYGTAAIDLPDEGITSKSPGRLGGQPYDMSQIDEADQFTFTLLRKPVTREDLEIQQKMLLDDKAIVPNGGLLYRYRKQAGYFDGPTLVTEPVNPASPPLLIYQGISIHTFDLWGQLLYQPDFETSIRFEVEGLVSVGGVDNNSGASVGDETASGDPAVNCFDDNVRLAEPDRCLGNEESIMQWGVGVQSEFKLGGPITFGLNGGAASGGSTPNYGLASSRPDYDFFRFSPDYIVDLILFRNVIGTVTNAAYYNPYVSAKLLESADSHVRLDLDGILSHALNKGGTPSGESNWLGLEFDAAARYIMLDAFEAAVEGGILFPFSGLNAAKDRPRYTTPGESANFGAEAEASIAWTVQFKFFWSF